jgi:hypothetical protein
MLLGERRRGTAPFETPPHFDQPSQTMTRPKPGARYEGHGSDGDAGPQARHTRMRAEFAYADSRNRDAHHRGRRHRSE